MAKGYMISKHTHGSSPNCCCKDGSVQFSRMSLYAAALNYVL